MRGTWLELAAAQLALGRAVGPRHLAGLHDLLEAAQVVLALDRRLLAEELGDRRAERPGGRRIAQLEADLGGTPDEVFDRIRREIG